MTLRINDLAPDFFADTTIVRINFHDWMGEGWAVLFSHPKDFTPVCTTELGYVAGLSRAFEDRNCKLIGLSVDGVEDHLEWKKDIAETTGNDVTYPLIGDPNLEIARSYGMLPADAEGEAASRSAADNATVRSLFIIGPDKRIKLSLTYPMTTGRNFDEVLRVLESLQLTHAYSVATPAQWQPGDQVIVVPSMSDAKAVSEFGSIDRVKPYLRYTQQPAK